MRSNAHIAKTLEKAYRTAGRERMAAELAQHQGSERTAPKRSCVLLVNFRV